MELGLGGEEAWGWMGWTWSYKDLRAGCVCVCVCVCAHTHAWMLRRWWLEFGGAGCPPVAGVQGVLVSRPSAPSPCLCVSSSL